MSLLNDLVGAAMGGGQQGGSDLLGGLMSQLGGQEGGNTNVLGMATQLIQSYPGGMEGLMQAFQNGGLGEVASSWISTGTNLPVSADQLQGAIGGEHLGAIAQQFGMSEGEAASGLASALPQLINGLTPNGEANSDLIQQGLSMLAGQLFK